MYIINCRVCKSTDLTDVISLGNQKITSRFPNYGDFSTPETDITLCLCNSCSLVQLRTTTESSELYEFEYGYNSGISNTMRNHLKQYQEEITNVVNFNEKDVVLDIGSNDSTMLHYYPSNLRRIGVDPTGNQFKENYFDLELLPTYFTFENVTKKFGDLKCKVISSISMFYDLPDPVQFAKDIYKLLDIDGIWTIEQSYICSMLESNSIDTICHEHLEYYSLTVVKNIADLSGFKIINVVFNNCNGGSFRVYFAKKESEMYIENINLVESIMSKESYLQDPITYFKFIENCNKEIVKLKEIIQLANSNNKKVYIYGASTKGNCLLQYANILESDVNFAVERNLKKVGKMTSTGIPIISESMMRENPPDYLLVLPWHFRDEIIVREKDFLISGGQFIFPFPEFQIVGLRQKVLITGCEGMISRYFIEQFSNDYYIYGSSKKLDNLDKRITKCSIDVNETEKLEKYIMIIKPDIIIHLASKSSSTLLDSNIIETIETNGMATVNLCDIIHRNNLKCKLFNASSSDIYKGRQVLDVKESDKFMFHSHPYSIAKILGTSIVDFYRDSFNLPFSNGIIFTTESKFKSEKFLLKKISSHIKEWKSGNQQVLVVGNLDSFRNILHALDTANAINYIINQNVGDNYNICNYNNHFFQIKDLVLEMYRMSDINLTFKDNIYYDQKKNQVLLIDDIAGVDSSIQIRINGDNQKLQNLGWKPKVDVQQILLEFLE